MQFQATCSKGNKKLTLTLGARDLEDARNILHSQGYSIIEIHEAIESTENGNFFYFDARMNGMPQTGKIQSTDIFKSYRKLVEDLKYDVIYIYTTKGMPEDQKKILTAKVKDGYRLYKESIGEDPIDDEIQNKSIDDQDIQEISPQVFKEIEKYTAVIDSTIIKIQNVFLKYKDAITPEYKRKLEYLENTLITVKGSKNLGKIKTTIEQTLMSIGEIEVALLKIGMTEEKQKFLQETNDLLKQVGSKDRIQTEQEKKESIEYKLSNFFSLGKKSEDTKPTKEKKDTASFIYFKNKRELDIYKKKLSSVEFDIIKNLVQLNFKNTKKLYLKRRLIKQNIQIIDNRINNRVISYTRVIRGVDYYIDVFFKFISTISVILFYSVFFYVVSVIIIDILESFGVLAVSPTAGKTVLLIAILSIIAFATSYIRSTVSLLISTICILSVSYFLIQNF